MPFQAVLEKTLQNFCFGEKMEPLFPVVIGKWKNTAKESQKIIDVIYCFYVDDKKATKDRKHWWGTKTVKIMPVV
jgi:hypothetical protein